MAVVCACRADIELDCRPYERRPRAFEFFRMVAWRFVPLTQTAQSHRRRRGIRRHAVAELHLDSPRSAADRRAARTHSQMGRTGGATFARRGRQLILCFTTNSFPPPKKILARFGSCCMDWATASKASA